MFNQILVPVDRSTLAEIALPHAVALAHALNSKLTLLHVLDLPEKLDRMNAVDPLEWRIRRAEVETYVAGLAERLSGLGLEVEAQTVEGDAAEQIVEYARSHEVDLILMSSHGRSGLTGWNVSSVVQKVILRAYTSVMIVRAYQPLTTDVEGLRYQRVLVALDMSQRAETVLPLAASLARSQGTQVILAHTVHRPEIPGRTPPSQEDVALVEQLVERNRREAVQYLSEMRTRIGSGETETRLLISERVAGSLHEIAEQEDADLVLLSAHGCTGETRWPYGSVVTSFIAYGTAPLLIVQDMGREQVPPTRAEIAAHSFGRR